MLTATNFRSLAMDYLYILDRFLVYSHVAAGMIGLLAAPVAMATTKGGKAHRQWGKVFFWMMFWIILSTFGLMFFRFNFFLLVIAVLSFYSALTGYRVLYLKRPQAGDTPQLIDWASSVIAALSGLSFAGWGVAGLLGLLGGDWPAAFFVLGLVFGGGLLANAVPDLVRYFNPPTDRNWWWYEHMNRMLSAYIAMVTAFLVQNIGRHIPTEWQWVIWVAPGVIGGFFIGKWITMYKQKFEGKRQVKHAPAGTD
jgi:uncharacterized membrane protein